MNCGLGDESLTQIALDVGRAGHGHVAHHTPVLLKTLRRMPMRLPEGFQDSHQDGGPLFLIVVADPRTVRLCTTHLAEERILIRRDLHRVLVTEAGELPAIIRTQPAPTCADS